MIIMKVMMSIWLIMAVMKMTTHLFGTLYLVQESVELPGFCVQRPTHCLVVTGGIRQARKMSRAQLQDREWSRGDTEYTLDRLPHSSNEDDV